MTNRIVSCTLAAAVLVCISILLPPRLAAHQASDCSSDKLPTDLAALGASLGAGAFPARCTHVVEEGRFGPFAIGDTNTVVLARLPGAGVRSVDLKPRYEGSLSVDDQRIRGVFDSEPRLLVWSRNVPLPLKLEFAGDTLTRVSGGGAELGSLRDELAPGVSRSQVVSSLAAHAGELEPTIGAFIPNGSNVPIPPPSDTVAALAARSDRWQFAGLTSECPFAPFYSRVRLSFEDGTRVRIEHFCFPWELP